MKIPFPTAASRTPLLGLLTALGLALSAPLHAADKGDAGALRPAAQDRAAALQDKAGASAERLKARTRPQAADSKTTAADKAATSSATATSKLRNPSASKASSPPSTARLDLNSAPEAELATLPGIGAARAKAIVKGRPYHGKDDLKRRKIVPAHVYEDIKERIIAHQR